MANKFKLLATVLLAQLAIVILSGSLLVGGNEIPESNHPLSPISLGTADGKSYYAKLEEECNTTEARDYCRSHNLTLATVETAGQVDLLKESLPRLLTTSTFFRVDAREFLAWNETGTVLHPEFFDSVDFRGGNSYCSTLFVTRSSNISVWSHGCSSRFAVLCSS